MTSSTTRSHVPVSTARTIVHETPRKTMKYRALEWVAAGIGCAVADSAMNPLEIMKVRLQLNGGSGAALSLPRLYREGATIYASDGIVGLYVPGLVATGLRGFFYAGFRIGMYPIVRESVQTGVNKNGDNFLVKLVAGGLTGAIGSFVFNPIDVVRVRFHRNPAAYPSTLGAFGRIYRAEGLSGMWSGGLASVTRSAMLSGSQLATYETFKRLFTKLSGLEENPILQSAASVSSGVVAQAIIMPVDNIKTQLMTARRAQGGGATATFSSITRRLLHEGGMRALYRGFTPAVARQGPCMLIQMPVIEYLRKCFGLDYL